MLDSSAAPLLALGVEVVDLLAGERRLAGRGAAVVLATALSPLVDAAGRGVGGSGRTSGAAAGRGVGGGAVALVGASDGTELDVGEGNLGVGDISLKVGGLARGDSARTSLRSNLGRVGWVGRVEPEHVGVVL